jgi:hypothetical protein
MEPKDNKKIIRVTYHWPHGADRSMMENIDQEMQRLLDAAIQSLLEKMEMFGVDLADEGDRADGAQMMPGFEALDGTVQGTDQPDAMALIMAAYAKGQTQGWA